MHITGLAWERVFGAASVEASGALDSLVDRRRTRKRKEGLTVQAKTALAVAGSVLAVPSAALAAADDDSNTAARDALHPSGKLTHDAELDARLVRTNVRLARREARLDGHKLRDGHARRARTLSVSVLRDRNHRLRKRITVLERRRRASTPSAPLEAIAACESGGDPSTNTGNGFYGKYQFTQSTWESVGGTGNPAAASEAEQDRRAAALYAQQGASPWPVCGR